MSSFILHKNFDQKHKMINLELCEVLLDDNALFPWFILVPRVANATEILDLTASQRAKMWLEVEKIAEFSKKYFNPDKLNIATLGNVTPQLHIHVISRFKTDAMWPQPIWTCTQKASYDYPVIEKIKKQLTLG